jgi:hypothetical protein
VEQFGGFAGGSNGATDGFGGFGEGAGGAREDGGGRVSVEKDLELLYHGAVTVSPTTDAVMAKTMKTAKKKQKALVEVRKAVVNIKTSDCTSTLHSIGLETVGATCSTCATCASGRVRCGITE